MFSILNEIKDNSPGSIVGVIGASIGSAASVYILVAITGYLTFGNNVEGNIVSMCRSAPVLVLDLTEHRRPRLSAFYNCQGGHRHSGDFQYSPASSSLPRFDRRGPEMASKQKLSARGHCCSGGTTSSAFECCPGCSR